MNEPLVEYATSREQILRLRKYVNAHSVVVGADRDVVKEMLNWCEENAGEERPYHPRHEADEGWMDYFEGEWACDRVERNFWFFNPKMLSAFMLRWSEYPMSRPE